MAVTRVSAAWPELVLAPLMTITVELDDTNADVTKLNVYGLTPPRVDNDPIELLPPLLTHEPQNTIGGAH